MTRRIMTVGLAALCAAAVSAISGSSATAATVFTCVPHVLGGTEDVDCAAGAGHGESGAVQISLQHRTSLADTKLTNTVLEGKLFGAAVQLEATGVECVSCTVENKEVGGVMEVTGSGGRLKFTGVTAVGLPKCNVNGGTITTEKLKFTTTVSTAVTLEPETGTTLAVFNITGESCTVAGSGIKVSGKAKSTFKGAKGTLNVTKASEELKLEGEKAALKGESTWDGGETGATNPVFMKEP